MAVELEGAFFAAMLSASGVGIPGVERLTSQTGGAQEAWKADAETLRRFLGENAAAALLALRREKPELPSYSQTPYRKNKNCCLNGRRDRPVALRF